MAKQVKVRALLSFVAVVDGRKFRAIEGDEFDLPAGVDWLAAGLVAPVGQEPEAAAVEQPEKAVKRPARKRKG